MEIYQLRQFLAVAETRSFTRAAEQLGVSQPALSTGISKLEKELGVSLLLRDRRASTLTNYGLSFVGRARQILDMCSASKAEMRTNDTRKAIRLGVMPSLPIQTVSAISKACITTFPDSLFYFREGQSAELHELIEKGKLDLALVSSSTSVDDHQQVPLIDEPYLIACHVDHPFARFKSIKLTDLNDQNFILRTSCEARRATQDILSSRGIRIRIVASTAQDDRALHLVGAGIGIALMPASFIARGVVRIPVSDYNIVRTLIVRMNNQSKVRPDVQNIFEFLRQTKIRYL